MKIIKVLTVIILLTLQANAFELDASVDDEIRKNYNPSALENSLPALPNIKPAPTNENSTPPKVQVNAVKTKPQAVIKPIPTYSNIDKSTAIRIKKGTKFKVKSSAYISDATKKGARLSFTTLYPVTQRYITIPQGTVFKAFITDSHLPQASGNGGLIKVEIDGVVYKGYLYGADGKVTKANGKKIFINNIKGERRYIKNVSTQVEKGQNFYKKTRRTSNKLADNPITLIVAPIPTIVGLGAYAINFVGSPLFALPRKGGRISITAGSEFEIKMLEDIYLQE